MSTVAHPFDHYTRYRDTTRFFLTGEMKKDIYKLIMIYKYINRQVHEFWRRSLQVRSTTTWLSSPRLCGRWWRLVALHARPLGRLALDGSDPRRLAHIDDWVPVRLEARTSPTHACIPRVAWCLPPLRGPGQGTPHQSTPPRAPAAHPGCGDAWPESHGCWATVEAHGRAMTRVGESHSLVLTSAPSVGKGVYARRTRARPLTGSTGRREDRGEPRPQGAGRPMHGAHGGRCGVAEQPSSRHPIRWWGMHPTVCGTQALDQPSEPHGASSMASRRERQQLNIPQVTVGQHGRRHAPRRSMMY